jgi:DNA polymerase elongation subunit (family B)
MTQPSYVNCYVSADDRVHFLYRKDGKLSRDTFQGEYAAFLRRADITPERERALRNAPSSVITGHRWDGDWLRLQFKNHDFRYDAIRTKDSWFNREGLQTFEADVGPSRRLMADKGFAIAKPKRICTDIETDSRLPFSRKEEMRVLSYALVDEETFIGLDENKRPQYEKKLLRILTHDDDSAERDLLCQFIEDIQAYDQVTAWAGDRFDFPVIQARCDFLGIDVDWRIWLLLDHLAAFKRIDSAESGEAKQSMKLEDVCQNRLGYGKSPFNAKFTWHEWHAGGERRKAMGVYNLQDTVLLADLERKTGYLALFQSVCEACGVFPDSPSLNPTLQVDAFMLRLGVERGHHFQTKTYNYNDENRQKFEGAFVMQPKEKGILKDVHVFDFAALYPSIIRTWNMSPETKGPRLGRNQLAENWCVAPGTDFTFRTDVEGILPHALSRLAKLRVKWSELQASLTPGTPEWLEAGQKSTAYKVTSNSFYGVVGSPFSRYFDKDIAESVTLNGQWLNKQTIKQAEESGMYSIYGDTDSAFLVDATEEEMRTFIEWCNREFYPYLLQQKNCKENFIKVAYEKQFARLVFVGAKKYAGRYEHYKGKRATALSKPEIKGLEWKRGDAIKLGRDMQHEVIELIIMQDVEDFEKLNRLCHRWRERVLQDELPLEQIKIAKTLSKPLKEYERKLKLDGTESADLAQVQVARILAERGEDVGEGTRIDYVVVNAVPTIEAIPAEDYDGTNVDRFYLWEKLIFPPTMRFLESAFPDQDWKGQWLKARPKKVTVRKRKMNPNQTQFTFDTPPVSLDDVSFPPYEPVTATRVAVDDVEIPVGRHRRKKTVA